MIADVLVALFIWYVGIPFGLWILGSVLCWVIEFFEWLATPSKGAPSSRRT